MARVYLTALIFALAIISLIGLFITKEKIFFGISLVVVFVYFYRLGTVDNLVSYSSLFAFMGGIYLLTMELFTPSFGILGACGLVLSFFSINKVFSIFSSYEVIGSAGIVFFESFIFLRYFMTKKENPQVLKDVNSGAKGFNSRKNLENLVGEKALSLTDLRPVGKIIIDGKIYDGETEGGYIKKDKKVVVTDFKDGSLFVREDMDE